MKWHWWLVPIWLSVRDMKSIPNPKVYNRPYILFILDRSKFNREGEPREAGVFYQKDDDLYLSAISDDSVFTVFTNYNIQGIEIQSQKIPLLDTASVEKMTSNSVTLRFHIFEHPDKIITYKRG